MRDDEKVEALLRRYRVRGPSDALRATCLSAPREARWPWLAAAALLAAAAGLHAASGQVQPVALSANPEAMRAAHVSSMLEGDPQAQQLAAAALARFRRDEASRRLDDPGPSRPGEESPR